MYILVDDQWAPSPTSTGHSLDHFWTKSSRHENEKNQMGYVLGVYPFQSVFLVLTQPE